MAGERSAAAEGVAQLVESLRGKGSFGACGGAGILLADVPPHWSDWLAGEIGTGRTMTWAAAATGVIAGLVWLGFRIAGQKPPRGLVDQATGENET